MNIQKDITKLFIPYALDDSGALCAATLAEKGRDYRCQSCLSRLVFRKGSIKVAHFAHEASKVCSGETVIHKTAKLLIQRMVQEWKKGIEKPPLLDRQCRCCSATVTQNLPDRVDDASLEWRLANGAVADVALTASGQLQAVVEIRVTHAVDAAKIEAMPVPMIELDGNAVVDSPYKWTPIVDHFKLLVCYACKSSYQRYKTLASGLADKFRMPLPQRYYRYGVCDCWKCKQRILVFMWPKDSMFDDGAPKQEPRPKTIQHRYSSTVGGRYWANTCPLCDALQGEFYLSMEPESPFFGLDEIENTDASYRMDMLKVALAAAENGLFHIEGEAT